MLIIDRFEEGIAVVEDSESEKIIKIEKSMIDEAAREGDVIFLSEQRYNVDNEATEERRKEMLKLLEGIDIKRKRRNDGGK